MKKILLIALCITIAIFLYQFYSHRSANFKTSMPIRTILKNSDQINSIPTETFQKTTNFLSCDTDADCSLDSRCVESSICPPCLTDENDRPVGNCTCTSVKKCEPK